MPDENIKKIKCYKCGQEIVMKRVFWDAMVNDLPKELEVRHVCGAVLFSVPKGSP